MLCQDIIKILEEQSPREYALSWDNVGLLVGRRNKDVKKILLAVDATYDVCKQAVDDNVDMIITHHPMIFSSMKCINSDTVLGEKILSLVESGIACYAMHTNFDTKGGMATLAADMLSLTEQEILEETCEGEGIGRIGKIKRPLTVVELAEIIKEKFDLNNVMIYGDIHKKVERIGICPGSGKSVIDVAIQKEVQCLVTGDIGHHEGIDAVDGGLIIIDASHYGIEKIFMKYMHGYLKDLCPGVEIDMADVGVPFVMI